MSTHENITFSPELITIPLDNNKDLVQFIFINIHCTNPEIYKNYDILREFSDNAKSNKEEIRHHSRARLFRNQILLPISWTIQYE